jgi:hypothetical protein
MIIYHELMSDFCHQEHFLLKFFNSCHEELAKDHLLCFKKNSLISKLSSIICEEAIQSRIVKITDGKFGHLSLSFSYTGCFLTEYSLSLSLYIYMYIFFFSHSVLKLHERWGHYRFPWDIIPE